MPCENVSSSRRVVSLFLALLLSATVVDASADETPSDARQQGAMQGQTEGEEARARDWTPPTGDEPVYTQDWVSRMTDVWARYLGPWKGRPNVRGLEIGSFEGRSAVWFTQNILTHPSSSLTCIDPFSERLHLFFDHNIRVTGVQDRIHKITGLSQDVLRALPVEEEFDFIYIDGCHLARCTLTDLVLSWALLKWGGLLLIDDYTWAGPALHRPAIAVDAFIQIYSPLIQVVHKGHQVILRKTSDD